MQYNANGITIDVDANFVRVTGQTFLKRRDIQATGAKWAPALKGWIALANPATVDRLRVIANAVR